MNASTCGGPIVAAYEGERNIAYDACATHTGALASTSEMDFEMIHQLSN